MELLTHHEYKILKMFKSKEILHDDIVLKIGNTAKERLIKLKKYEYICISSETDKWGQPQDPVKYRITIKGLAYLEDHKYFVCEERRNALCRSIIAPIVVSVLTTIVINSGILTKLLSLFFLTSL